LRPSTLSMLPPANHVLADVDYRLAVGALRTHDRVAQAEQPGVGCRPGTPPQTKSGRVLARKLGVERRPLRVRMKRERPADDTRRLAIKARLQGMPNHKIARHLGLSYHTVRNHLGNSGAVRRGRYHLNALTARALFTEHELLELGAVWTGRSWVGPRRVTTLSEQNADELQGAQEPVPNTGDRASGNDGYPSNHSRA